MAGTVKRLRRPAIAPSILTADFGRLADQVTSAEKGGAAMIHLDVMDGVFVPNMSFGPMVVRAVDQSASIPLDVHLMIQEPERYIDDFADAGADVITVHIEAGGHVHRTLQRIRSRDLDAGIAINPGTPLVAIEELLPFIDLVLVMTVNPGFGGQMFIPSMLGKIERLRQLLDSRKLEQVSIEVDGGISESNIGRVASAGAEVFVAGSSVYNDQQRVENAIGSLRHAATV